MANAPFLQISIEGDDTGLFSPHNHQTEVEYDDLSDIEYFLTHKAGAFEGYTIFVLVKRDINEYWNQNASLVIINSQGKIIYEKPIIAQEVWPVKQLSPTTFLYGDNGSLWELDISSNQTKQFAISPGHHEFEYNPRDHTLFTLDRYGKVINDTTYFYDRILEYNFEGEIIWELNTSDFITPNQWCPFEDYHYGGPDLTHGNTVFLDLDEGALYYNPRNLNTFYKIDYTTKKVIWALGEYGNFTLYNQNGQEKDCLFYHSHAVEKIDNHTFILFDNDYHNQENNLFHKSRILEIEVNSTSMQAREKWQWNGPLGYWTYVFGDADRLPNYNRLGTFGTQTHNFPGEPIGARLVEVSQEGKIVWEVAYRNTQKYQYSIYRCERFHLKPVILSQEEIQIEPKTGGELSISYAYNYRTHLDKSGSYQIFLEDELLDTGNLRFAKYWQAREVSVDLPPLKKGNYNLTIIIQENEYNFNQHTIHLTVANIADQRMIMSYPWEILLGWSLFGLVSILNKIGQNDY